MKIKTINLDDDGDPESIVVILTAKEAALLCQMIGSTSPSQRDDVMADGGVIGHGIYDELSTLANRFYENGVDEMVFTVTN